MDDEQLASHPAMQRLEAVYREAAWQHGVPAARKIVAAAVTRVAEKDLEEVRVFASRFADG